MSTKSKKIPQLDELRTLKVALVCDWLTNVGGAEKVLLELHQLFPDAPIYTSQYRPKKIDWFKDADVRTGWLQKFPVKLRRVLGPLRHIYFSHLDLSDYDLVISVTGAEAKAVRVDKGTHISYCHVPTQYYWQMYDEYIKNPGFGILNPIIRLFFRLLVTPLRHIDCKAAQRPDYYVTISEYAKEQIKKYYGREATVIHPPVELDDFHLKGKQPPIRLKDDYDLSDAYVITSRQVNWKHVDLAVRAAFLSQRHVVIIGEGPEHKKLVKQAKGSDLVQFLPLMQKDELAKYLNQARGFLFPSLEPFGIAPVEALAAGCPVVAFDQGGAKDYVKPGKNGVLFSEQTPISLAEGMLELEKLRLNRKKISQTADIFSQERFDRELVCFVSQAEEGKDVAEIAQALQESSSKEPSQKTSPEPSEPTQGVSEPPQKTSSPKTSPKTSSKSPHKPQSTSVKKSKAQKSKKSPKIPQTAKTSRAKSITKTIKNIQKALEPPKSPKSPEHPAESPQSSKASESSEPPQSPKASESPEPPKSSESPESRAFPKIREDVEHTQEMVKKAEAAKEANRPAFPKIGGKI